MDFIAYFRQIWSSVCPGSRAFELRVREARCQNLFIFYDKNPFNFDINWFSLILREWEFFWISEVRLFCLFVSLIWTKKASFTCVRRHFPFILARNACLFFFCLLQIQLNYSFNNHENTLRVLGIIPGLLITLFPCFCSLLKQLFRM